MLVRSATLIRLIACLTIIVSSCVAWRPTITSAADEIALPWHGRPVSAAPTASGLYQSNNLASGPVSVIVHINVPPLAAVGKHWSHQQRLAHVATIRAAQDEIAPRIEALGGAIRGRFTHASAGVGALIDASKLDQIGSLGGVLDVRAVADYHIDLSETAAFIGARDVARLGLTGTGIDVAIIDSGVDYTHVKLGGPGTRAAYAEAYCGDATATPDPAEASCAAHQRADTTGFFGDPNYGRDGSPDNKIVGGYDWVGEVWPNADPRCAAAGNPTVCPLADPNPIDFQGHGTHVADIIGGLESTSGAADAGVAPGVNLWSFKACSAISGGCNGLALLLALDDSLDLDNSDSGACTPGVEPYCLAYDPADVINMSLGQRYGQPEDDLTLFANLASFYGSLVVASAGNGGDVPYNLSSPSTAEAAVSVAESSPPSAKADRISAGGVTATGMLQRWAPAPTAPLAGPLQYGDGVGGNLLGCDAFAAGSLQGKVLLLDRGGCAASIKGANGAAVGAMFVVVADTVFSNWPVPFSYGGGDVTVPVYSTTQGDGVALKGMLGTPTSVGPDSFIALPDDLVASSSRGPRIADGAIKPDMAAPGGSVSARVGTGTATTAFYGTSAAAPMVAGAAALLIQRFEARALLDSHPGLDAPLGSLAPLIKALLMNTTNPSTFVGGSSAAGGRGFLAPITLQGAGRVDVRSAVASNTIAWDVTALASFLDAPDSPVSCDGTPARDVLLYGFPRRMPPCWPTFSFGNDLFRAWNAQTGSLSFGYHGVSDTTIQQRTIAILNMSDTTRTYTLGTSLRYLDDQRRGVSPSLAWESVTIEAGSVATVDMTLEVHADDLRNWTLDAGAFGNAGTNTYCGDPDPVRGCPTLTLFEYDGYVTIDGGADNIVRLPWQVLPKRAAATYVQGVDAQAIGLHNPAPYQVGDAAVLALVELSPNNCEIIQANGSCLEDDYIPGSQPGINTTYIDIKEFGLRSYVVPGVNAALGLPAAPSGALDDEVIDFGLTVYDAPFRAAKNYPIKFNIPIDSNSDGTDDYEVFIADAVTGGDGRSTVFVQDINPADGTRPTRPYFRTVTDFNSQNWLLPVPAAAIDVRSDRPFTFRAMALDVSFGGPARDCSPRDCVASHSVQTGLLKYQPASTSIQIPMRESYRLAYSTPEGGATASPSQIGVLLMYRHAPVGRESDSVQLP